MTAIFNDIGLIEANENVPTSKVYPICEQVIDVAISKMLKTVVRRVEINCFFGDVTSERALKMQPKLEIAVNAGWIVDPIASTQPRCDPSKEGESSQNNWWVICI